MFDDYQDQSARFRRLLISSIEENADPPNIDQMQVLKDIMHLKNNKAPDIYGISAEHMKYASMEQMLPMMTYNYHQKML